MIDFASVTGIQIPEGSANALAIGGAEVWTADRWDIEWEYNGALPPSNVWDYTGANVSISPAEGGIVLQPQSGGFGFLSLWSDAFNAAWKCSFEIEIKITEVAGYIVAELGSEMEEGTSSSIKCTFSDANNGNLNLQLPSSNQNVSMNAWHKIRLDLDRDNDVNRVWLNGVNVSTVDNSKLNVFEISGPAVGLYNSKCIVRALRYKTA